VGRILQLAAGVGRLIRSWRYLPCRSGDIFPVEEEGVLIDVEMAEADNTMPRHLTKRSNTAGTPRRGCSAAMMMRRSSLASSRFSKAASAGR
jgi:hypothetical protein